MRARIGTKPLRFKRPGQLLCGHRARDIGLGADDAAHARREPLAHLFRLLIAHHRADEHGILLRHPFIQISAERAHAGIIVRAVEQHMAEIFQPPRPMHVGQPRANGARRDLHSLLFERQQRPQRRAGVVRLMPAAEGDGQPLESFAAEGRVKFNLLTLLSDVFRRQFDDRQFHPLRRRQQHAARGLFLPAQHDGHAGLHDTRFFQRNLFDRIAKQLHVIHAHFGNDADGGADDIRRVKPPAEADFDHRDIDFFFFKAAEGKRRAQLELGDVHALFFAFLHRGPDAFHQCGQLFARNGFAVQADALVIDLDIRRRVQSGLIPRRAEHTLGHRAARTLAVRSCDMHHRQTLLGIAELRHQGAHIFKAVFTAGRVHAVNFFDCFLFRHGVTSFERERWGAAPNPAKSLRFLDFPLWD